MSQKDANTPPETLEELQELVGYQLRASAFESASIALRAYLRRNPQERWAMHELSRCLLRLEEWEHAEQVLLDLEEAYPGEAETIALFGLAYQAQGALDKARKQYEDALAIEMLEWAAYNLAQIAVDQQDEATAEKWFDQLLERDPDNFAARYQRALLYTRTGRTGESRDELVEVINSNPLMLQPYLLLSELFLREGFAAQAIELLGHGLVANPTAHPLREELARVFTMTGDMEAAFGIRLELARLRGTVGDFLDLGQAALLNQSQEHAAIAYAKAIKLAPEDWRGYYNLAEMYRAAEDYASALPLYHEALRCEQGDCIYNALGLWHLEAEEAEANPQLAKECFQEALLLNPEMPEAHYNLVLALAKCEEKEEARKALADLKQMLPQGHPLQEGVPALTSLTQ